MPVSSDSIWDMPYCLCNSKIPGGVRSISREFYAFGELVIGIPLDWFCTVEFPRLAFATNWSLFMKLKAISNVSVSESVTKLDIFSHPIIYCLHEVWGKNTFLFCIQISFLCLPIIAGYLLVDRWASYLPKLSLLGVWPSFSPYGYK